MGVGVRVCVGEGVLTGLPSASLWRETIVGSIIVPSRIWFTYVGLSATVGNERSDRPPSGVLRPSFEYRNRPCSVGCSVIRSTPSIKIGSS